MDVETLVHGLGSDTRAGLGVITAIGMATEIGAIAHLLDATPEKVTPLQKEVREIGRMLGIAVLVIASVVVVAVLMLTDVGADAELAHVPTQD